MLVTGRKQAVTMGTGVMDMNGKPILLSKGLPFRRETDQQSETKQKRNYKTVKALL